MPGVRSAGRVIIGSPRTAEKQTSTLDLVGSCLCCSPGTVDPADVLRDIRRGLHEMLSLLRHSEISWVLSIHHGHLDRVMRAQQTASG